jgi:hypothetical protein
MLGGASRSMNTGEELRELEERVNTAAYWEMSGCETGNAVRGRRENLLWV